MGVVSAAEFSTSGVRAQGRCGRLVRALRVVHAVGSGTAGRRGGQLAPVRVQRRLLLFSFEHAVLFPLAGLDNPDLGLRAQPAQLLRLRNLLCVLSSPSPCCFSLPAAGRTCRIPRSPLTSLRATPLTCVPNLDGPIGTANELAPALGVTVRNLVNPAGQNRTVDLVGTVNEQNRRVWNFGVDYADDQGRSQSRLPPIPRGGRRQ